MLKTFVKCFFSISVPAADWCPFAGKHWPFRPFPGAALRCAHSSSPHPASHSLLASLGMAMRARGYKCFLSTGCHHSLVSYFFEELQLMFYLPRSHHSCVSICLISEMYAAAAATLHLSGAHQLTPELSVLNIVSMLIVSEPSKDITLQTRGNSQNVVVSLTRGANVRFQKRQRIQEPTFQPPPPHKHYLQSGKMKSLQRPFISWCHVAKQQALNSSWPKSTARFLGVRLASEVPRSPQL